MILTIPESFVEQLEISCLSLDEVLSNSYEPLPENERNPLLATERFDRWVEIAAGGDSAQFARRLEVTSLSFEDVLARFGGVRRAPDESPPDWIGDVHSTIELLRKEGSDGSRWSNIPFGPLLGPVLEWYSAKLWSYPGIADVDPPIRCKIEDHLAMKIASLCEMPFYEQMLIWRAERIAEAEAGDPDAMSQLLAEDLKHFISWFRRTGMDRLVTRCPVLFRVMAVSISQWLAAYGSFLRRLMNDRAAIAATPGMPAADEVVTQLEWGHSDPHNGGHSVLSIRFSGGSTLFYKPKDLGADLFLAEFIARMKASGYRKELTLPRALQREGYGWTISVEKRECAHISDIRRYYHRFGAWLAIFHVLSASDMHMENFIADGAFPVPVDFEMLLQSPRQRPALTTPATEAEWLATRFLEHSVQSTGMLPSYVLGARGELISLGALEASVYPVQTIHWSNLNTPRMLLASKTEQVTIRSNLPTLRGESIGIEGFRDEFLAGFRSTLEFVASAAAELAPMVEHAVLPLRRVIRPTRYYYMLMKRLRDHRRMVDGLSWSLEADFSARTFDWQDSSDQPWKLLASERRQLCSLDIPHFVMSSLSNIISDRNGPVTRLHVDLGRDISALRIRRLKEDIDGQELVTRASLQMPIPAGIAPPAGSTDDASAGGLRFAAALRDDILSRAFRSEQAIAWLGISRIDHEIAAQLGPTGYDLYQGSTGIALFLACLSKGGDADAKAQSIAALGGVIQYSESGDLARLTRSIGIGGMVGIGSIVYGLGAVADLLSYEPALHGAERFAAAISDEAIAVDDRFDVVSGAAGATLSLLALHRRSGSARWLERAVACGEHLLKHRNAEDGQWTSAAFSRPLTGFAHGAAGIALAMSRLYRATCDERFRLAAQAAVAFENTHFSDAVGNWLDLRPPVVPGPLRSPDQWCYGATGIGLARNAMVDDGALPPDILTTDVARSILHVRNSSSRTDSLCCGIAGKIEMLRLSGCHAANEDGAAIVASKLSELEARWHSDRDFRWNGGTRHFNPGLFQGMSGIGLAALRAAGVNFASPLILN